MSNNHNSYKCNNMLFKSIKKVKRFEFEIWVNSY